MIHLAYKVRSIDSLANNPSLTNLSPKTQIFDIIVGAIASIDN
jgi:hypothetical protein